MFYYLLNLNHHVTCDICSLLRCSCVLVLHFQGFRQVYKEKGWTRFNYWGLHLFIGKFGGGKTISAVRRAYITAMFRLTSCGVSMILLRWLIPCLIRNTYQMRRSLLTEPEPDSLPILSAIRKRSADLAGR